VVPSATPSNAGLQFSQIQSQEDCMVLGLLFFANKLFLPMELPISPRAL